MQNHKCWSIALGPGRLLFGYDCGEGPMSLTCLCFCLGFGIMIARYIIKKPRNLYAIPECTYGVEGIGCEIVVAVGVG